MLLVADKIYQGTSQINLGAGPGVDTPLVITMGLWMLRFHIMHFYGLLHNPFT